MNEEMRKEFEKFYIKNLGTYTSPDARILEKDGTSNDAYKDLTVDFAWFFWQASREAMKPIKLPVKMKNTEAAECYYYNDAIDECKEAIEQAGYKVEP